MPEKWQGRLGALIARYRGPMSQGTLADLISEKSGQRVQQYLVSEHERGNRWSKHMELIGVYADVLSIPMDEIYQAMDLPHIEPSPAPRGFGEIVAQDKTLSKTAKEHLLNQYELLQMATMHERAGNPVLHEGTREDSGPESSHPRKRA